MKVGRNNPCPCDSGLWDVGIIMKTTNKREIIVFGNHWIYLLEVQLENLNNNK